MKVNELSNVDVIAVSLVNKGANRKQFFLRKAADEEKNELLTLPAGDHRLLKAEDWSAVYCVVAEPGALEDSGIGGTEVADRWASDDEIRKACHRFAKNGALINQMHQTLDPYGVMVENAIAPVDFEVEGHTIRKGSWYIAIEPNQDGRNAIEKGELTGVSIEGTGLRTTVEKAGEDDHAELDRLLVTDTGGIKKAAGPSLDRKPGTSNWVDQVGGLPDLIDRAARHLHYEKGRSISAAIATAVNWAKKMCSTGTAFGGKVSVSAGAQARACKAVAEWEAKKKAARVKKAKGHGPETELVVAEVLGSTADRRSVEPVEKTLLQKIGEKVGLTPADLEETEIRKAATFADRMAADKLDDELPKGMDLLRQVIFRVVHDPDTDDPMPVIRASVNEFCDWADGLLGSPEGIQKQSDLINPEGSTNETRTTDGEMETEEITQKFDGLEEKVETLTKSVETLVTKLAGDNGDGEITPESVAKRVEGLADLEGEELTKRLDSIEADLKKLGAGDSSQSDENTDATGPDKAAIAKAYEDEGVPAVLGGLI